MDFTRSVASAPSGTMKTWRTHSGATLPTTLPKDGRLMEMQRQEKVLLDKKIALMKQQADISAAMTQVLDNSDHGLNVTTKHRLANTSAAISIGRLPGYFRYYTPPAEAAAAESQHILRVRAREIARLQDSIDKVTSEHASLQAAIHKYIHEDKNPPINTLGAWFASYDRPVGVHGSEYGSTLSPPRRRVYGSPTVTSPHGHRAKTPAQFGAFTSVAVTMTRGRMLK